MKSRRRLLLDVESTSTVDLKTAGAAAYWAHPDTKIICLVYQVAAGPKVRWYPGLRTPSFVPEINAQDWRVVAHNYLFEYNCWIHQLAPIYGWALPSLDTWDCTMARALYWGLPAGLGDVCEALHARESVFQRLQLRRLEFRLRRRGHG